MGKLEKQKKLLAVASAGGHWVQLLRLRPAFNNMNTEYVSTLYFSEEDLNSKLHLVQDANISEKIHAIKMSFQMLWIMIKVRPDYVVSTGALPGLVAIVLGKLFGAKTVWLDSIANSEKLSLSGRYAKKFATVWLTQWPNLSHDGGPDFWGRVI